MKIEVKALDGETIEGVLALKDESIVIVKKRDNIVRVFHWNIIESVKRVYKGMKQDMNLDIFKKVRE
jgi:hypothetical protein